MNSTLKRILELLLLGATIAIGIAIVFGKITIYESWFSLRTFQVSFGSSLFILLLVYIGYDRKDLGPNKLKALLRRSYFITVLLFSVFLWGILSQPTLPVNVSFEGVAKTADLMTVNRNIEKTNQNVVLHSARFTSYEEKQRQENADLLQEVKKGNDKAEELDADERLRQEATSDQIADVATDIKKVSVAVDDVKNIDRKSMNGASVVNAFSEKSISIVIPTLFIFAVTSFVVSFFYNKHEKIFRWGIPGGLVLICIGLFFYPMLINKTISPRPKKGLQETPVVEKKETVVPVDTSITKTEQRVVSDTATTTVHTSPPVEVSKPDTEKKDTVQPGSKPANNSPSRRNWNESKNETDNSSPGKRNWNK